MRRDPLWGRSVLMVSGVLSAMIGGLSLFEAFAGPDSRSELSDIDPGIFGGQTATSGTDGALLIVGVLALVVSLIAFRFSLGRATSA